MISFIVPTLNEKKNVYITVNKIKDCFKKSEEFEIIFVDDKSTDGTINEINSLKKKYNNIKLVVSEKRKGLGNALILGQSFANGKYFFFLDCDNSINYSDILKIILLKDERKVIIGSRYIKNSKVYGVNKLKLFLSKTLNILVSNYLGINAIDISHSCRLFPCSLVFKPNNLQHPIFFWEHSYLSVIKGFQIVEIPINFYERLDGITKNSIFKLFVIIIKNIHSVFKLKKEQKR